MRKMRGQISLELLLIILILIAALSIIVPNIQSVKEVGDYALDTRNAQLILDKIAAACERVLITASEEKIEIHSLADYDLTTKGSTLTISFQGYNGTRELEKQLDLSCVANQALEIKKGWTELEVKYKQGSARVSYPDS